MASPADQYFTIGKEAAYGTQAGTLTRGIEHEGPDDWADDVELQTSEGYRAGAHGKIANREETVPLGATGRLSIPFLTKGSTVLLEDLLGAKTDPVEQGTSSGVYKAIVETDDAGPTDSYTIQKGTVDETGVMRPFTYLGCMPTGFELTVSRGGSLMLNVDYDAREVKTDVGAVTPVYTANTGGRKFRWDYGVVSWGGNPIPRPTAFSVEADLMMRTDRFYSKGTHLKDIPLRDGIPIFDATVESDFDGISIYQDWKAGTIRELIYTLTFPTQTGGINPQVKVTMPACKINSAPAQSVPRGTATQTVEFEVLWNETDPLLKIETLTLDSAWI